MKLLGPDDWSDSPEPGIYDGITDPQYHGLTGFLSNTLLKKVRRSPAHALHGGAESGISPALKFGRAAHDIVLRPSVFEKSYAQFEGDRRRKDGKERYAGLLALYDEWSILTRDEYRNCLGIRDAIYSHPIAAAFFGADGYEELTSIWEVEGVAAKSKLDKFAHGSIIDLKTTVNAKPSSWKWDALKKYRYDQQAAFYLASMAYHGVKVNEFIFVAVEKVPPYGISCHIVPRATLEAAWTEIVDLVGAWKAARESGEYPCYPEEMNELAFDWEEVA